MTTIYISEKTKEELTRIMGELQAEIGKRVDFDDVVRYLILVYRNMRKRRILFKKFTEPIPGVKFDDVYEELLEERRRDEENL